MIILLISFSIILISLFYKKTVPNIEGWRKILLISLRTISVIILLLLLLNPVLYYFKSKIIKPFIIILNDVSESMHQVGEEASKLEVFKNIQTEIEKNLVSEDLEIITLDFADGIDGNKISTNITKTLLQTFKKINPDNIEAIILLSDGWFIDEDLEIIENQNIPIHTFNPNYKSNTFDLRISEVNHNKSVYRNEITPIVVDIISENYYGKAKVELLSEDKIVNERVIDLDNKEFLQLTFDASFANSSFTPICVRISADSTEINTDNNIVNSAIQVKRDRSKCLLISDNLTWEASFIVDAINRDTHWQSKFVLKNDEFRSAENFTQLKTEINEINVLTLINNGNLFFSKNEVTIIERFVKNGGGLFIIGKPIKEFENISPTTSYSLDRNLKSSFTLTNQSEQFNTFSSIEKKDFKNIPPVSYYNVRSKIQAKVLARMTNEEKSPGILFLNNGKGKILNFVFLDLWKWQLWNSGDSYNNFIHNIFSWLGQTNSQRFYASLEKNSYFLGEDINIDLHAYDERLTPITEMNAEISVTNSAGTLVHHGFMLNKNNKHFAILSALYAGNYKYVITDNISKLVTEGEFMISKNSSENRDTGINLSLLSYISNKTNGKVLYNASDLKISELERKILRVRYEVPIYKKWYVIIIFILAFCTELFLRKRWGLL